jgi:hypothetical protein
MFSLLLLSAFHSQHIDPFGHSSTQAEIFAKMGLPPLSFLSFSLLLGPFTIPLLLQASTLSSWVVLTIKTAPSAAPTRSCK